MQPTEIVNFPLDGSGLAITVKPPAGTEGFYFVATRNKLEFLSGADIPRRSGWDREPGPQPGPVLPTAVRCARAHQSGRLERDDSLHGGRESLIGRSPARSGGTRETPGEFARGGHRHVGTSRDSSGCHCMHVLGAAPLVGAGRGERGPRMAGHRSRAQSAPERRVSATSPTKHRRRPPPRLALSAIQFEYNSHQLTKTALAQVNELAVAHREGGASHVPLCCAGPHGQRRGVMRTTAGSHCGGPVR